MSTGSGPVWLRRWERTTAHPSPPAGHLPDGTSVRDPNGGELSIFGGQPTSPGALLPLNADAPCSGSIGAYFDYS